jgi:hypothetical protein
MLSNLGWEQTVQVRATDFDSGAAVLAPMLTLERPVAEVKGIARIKCTAERGDWN